MTRNDDSNRLCVAGFDLEFLMSEHSLPPLFLRYPSLQGALPYLSLTKGPSEVQPLKCDVFPGPVGEFWVKRDDKNGTIYGGNKPRKLEWLLADALQRQCTGILTFGAFGSHHTLASALYANSVGLRSRLVLVWKPLLPGTLKSLALSQQHGASLIPCSTEAGTILAGVSTLLKSWLTPGEKLYLIGPGGSSVRGSLGFVNAALELAGQIKENQLPEPDVLFVPVGSCGTMAGLLVGCRLAGLKTQVVGVRVSDSFGMNARGVQFLANSLLRWLSRKVGKRLKPLFKLREVTVLEEFLGEGYSVPTEEGEQAFDCFRRMPEVSLEPVYSCKTMAALMTWAKEGKLEGKKVLFWNTYNSLPLEPLLTEKPEVSQLPAGFHPFFQCLPEP